MRNMDPMFFFYEIDSLNPSWPPFTIPIILLGENDQKLSFQVNDWNLFEEEVLIGECSTSMRELSDVDSSTDNHKTFELINFDLQRKKGAVNHCLKISFYSLSFLDLIN